MQTVFTESLLARAVFARSIKVLGWQSGAPEVPGARFSENNLLIFLKIIESLTPLGVL